MHSKKKLSLLVTDTMYGISGLVGDKRRSVYWRAACAIHAERLYIIAKTVFGIDTTDAFTKYVTEMLMLCEPVLVHPLLNHNLPYSGLHPSLCTGTAIVQIVISWNHRCLQ